MHSHVRYNQPAQHNTVGLKTGNTVSDLIDMRPLNQAVFETSSTATTQADTVVTRFDFAFGSYVTILLYLIIT